MIRFEAFAHGIRVGYQWAGMTLAQAVKIMNDFQTAAVEALDSPAFVYQQWSDRSKDLWKQSQQYLQQLKITLHQRAGPNCSDPNVDADGLNLVTPDYPDDARNVEGVVTAKVLVNLDAVGKVTNVTVQQSSFYSFFDRATLDAARASTYLPKIQNCVPVPGTYLFVATFDPNS